MDTKYIVVYLWEQKRRLTMNTEKLIQHIKDNYDPNRQLRIVVDLFCGGGGTTSGFKKVPNTFVVACLNHDPFAIKSHFANHPHCRHFTEDIKNPDVIIEIKKIIDAIRKEFDNMVLVLHGSVDCTHFSKAKGGESRDADSRTLANYMLKYLVIDPDYMTVENVDEFLSWGPLYQVQNEEGLFKYKIKRTIVFYPSAYHENEEYFDSIGAKPFMLPIKERKAEFYNEWVSDMSDLGYKHEYKMLNAANFEAYTSRNRYFGIFAKGDLPISFPKPTRISRKKHHLSPHLKLHKPVKDVLNLDVIGRSVFGLTLLGKKYSPNTITRVTGGVIKTAESKEHNVFLSSYYGTSQNGQGITNINDACNTVLTKDTFSAHHIIYAYGNTGGGTSINDAANSITTVPKHELLSMQWLYDHQFNREAMSVDKPSATLIAKMDKKPMYLATAVKRAVIDQRIDQPGDSKEISELRAVLRKYGILDVKIRALEVVELLRIQGFPEDYILLGGSTRAKKYIGNSVVPQMAECFLTELLTVHEEHINKVA